MIIIRTPWATPFIHRQMPLRYQPMPLPVVETEPTALAKAVAAPVRIMVVLRRGYNNEFKLVRNMNNQNFTEKQIGNFVGFFNALKKVHVRLVKEGYKISEGKITPPDRHDIGGGNPV